MKKKYSVLVAICLFAVAVTSLAYLLAPSLPVHDNTAQVLGALENATSKPSAAAPSHSWWTSHLANEICMFAAGIATAIAVVLSIEILKDFLQWPWGFGLTLALSIWCYIEYKRLNTDLLACARTGRLYYVERLLIQGANIHTKDRDGNTPCLLSAQEGQIDCLKFLRQHRANIYAKNKHGNTALILSAKNGHLEVVTYLVQQGADTTWRGEDQKTALAWAEARGHQAVANYLSNHFKEKGSQYV